MLKSKFLLTSDGFAVGLPITLKKMKEPKTIVGYINLIRKIEKFSVSDKLGFDKLEAKKRDALMELSASISNIINELEFDKPEEACGCKPVKTKDEHGNNIFVSPWCWRCNNWRKSI